MSETIPMNPIPPFRDEQPTVTLPVISPPLPQHQPGRWGDFYGDVVAKWLSRGNSMELMEDFYFVGPDGQRWEAPAGSIVDGASIPRFFWRFIGSPFTGFYRRASVVHDVYCNLRTRPSSQVHEMFYNAMRAEGCGALRSRIMYWAVRLFGPRFSGAKP